MSKQPVPSTLTIITIQLLIILSVFLAASVAFGQTTIAVDINKARFQWDAPTTGGTPTEYHVKCGPTTGTYTLPVTKVLVPATTIPVKTVVTSVGKYFCVVSAANSYGESGNTAEISFDAGDVPGVVSNLKIVVP